MRNIFFFFSLKENKIKYIFFSPILNCSSLTDKCLCNSNLTEGLYYSLKIIQLITLHSFLPSFIEWQNFAFFFLWNYFHAKNWHRNLIIWNKATDYYKGVFKKRPEGTLNLDLYTKFDFGSKYIETITTSSSFQVTQGCFYL